jgi:hypothetical protein
MTADNLTGPYTLNYPLVDQQTRHRPGVFILGRTNEDDAQRFDVWHVGWADADLNRVLKDWIGEHAQFKYLECELAEAAAQQHQMLCEALAGSIRAGSSVTPEPASLRQLVLVPLRNAAARLAAAIRLHPQQDSKLSQPAAR